ncbi:MAG TPA: sigma-70 family RNA polymerase sigma factor [Bryobacteraceae bacterium]|nr:sigma-70 family RNA polymerase sigma factor [Bryobacteraceae bacterium]
MPAAARPGRRIMVATMRAAEQEIGDEVLIRRANSGDGEAFGTLYTRYARMVHGILLSRVPFCEAEDLVQEVFVSALRKLALLREPGAFRGWLASIARNRAIEYHRGARDTVELHENSAAGRAGQADQHEALEILEIICKLPEAYRETLILRLVEGMTGPEIAERTGMTHQSVRVNLHRGIKMLRERLGGTTP